MPHLDQQKLFIIQIRVGSSYIGSKALDDSYEQEAFETVKLSKRAIARRVCDLRQWVMNGGAQ